MKVLNADIGITKYGVRNRLTQLNKLQTEITGNHWQSFGPVETGPNDYQRFPVISVPSELSIKKAYGIPCVPSVACHY